MKRILTLAMMAAFSFAIVGCEANARVGDPDGTSVDVDRRDGTNYSKKTTTVREPDGDVKTKTETHVDR
jgi:hypothetical protein